MRDKRMYCFDDDVIHRNISFPNFSKELSTKKKEIISYLTLVSLFFVTRRN